MACSLGAELPVLTIHFERLFNKTQPKYLALGLINGLSKISLDFGCCSFGNRSDSDRAGS